MKLFISCLFIFFLIFNLAPNQANAKTEELPECVVITHCVKENLRVKDLNKAFIKAKRIVSNTPRTKIVEQDNSFIHAEAKTKWRRYTDDLLLKTIPEKGVIQVRSESRVGIGDNGVNKKRIEDFKYRLMTEKYIGQK